MTLSILLGTFGQVSMNSIPANALILWRIPPLMILGGLAALLFLFLPPLGAVFLYFSLPVHFIYRLFTEALQQLPFL